MKVKVISLPNVFQVLYVLCFTRPRYQVSVYRTNGPLVSFLNGWEMKFVLLQFPICRLFQLNIRVVLPDLASISCFVACFSSYLCSLFHLKIVAVWPVSSQYLLVAPVSSLILFVWPVSVLLPVSALKYIGPCGVVSNASRRVNQVS